MKRKLEIGEERTTNKTRVGASYRVVTSVCRSFLGDGDLWNHDIIATPRNPNLRFRMHCQQEVEPENDTNL